MNDYILNHEQAIRLICFLGIFAIMAMWELLAPRRRLSQPKLRRWFNNLGLAVFNTALLVWRPLPSSTTGVFSTASKPPAGWH
jgi:hypothetical protein